MIHRRSSVWHEVEDPSRDEIEPAPNVQLELEVQDALFSMLAGSGPTIDVTSSTPHSSRCPRKVSTQVGFTTPLAGEFVYTQPLPKDVMPVLDRYWEEKEKDPYRTSGMFVLPHTAICDKEIVKRLVGMEVFKSLRRV